ncbi:MAG TPA: acyltransferase [Gemmataceae bacterium]|jgi:peptidoglycan/LPS O-acetylase OafA/YrhL
MLFALATTAPRFGFAGSQPSPPQPTPAGAPGKFRLGHRPELEGLRGLAVLFIMAGHLPLLGAQSDLAGYAGAPANAPFPGGFYGIYIFFVLSGFLITVLLAQEHQAKGSISLGAFYIRRVLRLLPGYAVFLTVCCAYALFGLGPAQGRTLLRGLGLSACYASNFYWCFPRERLGMLTHTWSFCLQEQFYLIWPVALCLLLRLRVRWIVTLLALGVVASALFRFTFWWAGGVTGFHVASTTLPARGELLLSGALAAVLACRGRLPRSRTGQTVLRSAASLAVLGLAGLVAWCGNGPHLFCGVSTLTGVLIALAIAGLIGAPPAWLRTCLSIRPLLAVSRISYGLYLWHVPAYCVVPGLLARWLLLREPAGTLIAALTVGLAFVAAAASYYLVERPCLRVKTFFSRA